MAINEQSLEVRAAKLKAAQLMPMVREWRERLTAMQNNPATTKEEYRTMYQCGVELLITGMDLAIPYMYDEDFPIQCRKDIEAMMAEIPIFKEVNGIL